MKLQNFILERNLKHFILDQAEYSIQFQSQTLEQDIKIQIQQMVKMLVDGQKDCRVTFTDKKSGESEDISFDQIQSILDCNELNMNPNHEFDFKIELDSDDLQESFEFLKSNPELNKNYIQKFIHFAVENICEYFQKTYLKESIKEKSERIPFSKFIEYLTEELKNFSNFEKDKEKKYFQIKYFGLKNQTAEIEEKFSKLVSDSSSMNFTEILNKLHEQHNMIHQFHDTLKNDIRVLNVDNLKEYKHNYEKKINELRKSLQFNKNISINLNNDRFLPYKKFSLLKHSLDVNRSSNVYTNTINYDSNKNSFDSFDFSQGQKPNQTESEHYISQKRKTNPIGFKKVEDFNQNVEINSESSNIKNRFLNDVVDLFSEVLGRDISLEMNEEVLKEIQDLLDPKNQSPISIKSDKKGTILLLEKTIQELKEDLDTVSKEKNQLQGLKSFDISSEKFLILIKTIFDLINEVRQQLNHFQNNDHLYEIRDLMRQIIVSYQNRIFILKDELEELREKDQMKNTSKSSDEFFNLPRSSSCNFCIEKQKLIDELQRKEQNLNDKNSGLLKELDEQANLSKQVCIENEMLKQENLGLRMFKEENLELKLKIEILEKKLEFFETSREDDIYEDNFAKEKKRRSSDDENSQTKNEYFGYKNIMNKTLEVVSEERSSIQNSEKSSVFNKNSLDFDRNFRLKKLSSSSNQLEIEINYKFEYREGRHVSTQGRKLKGQKSELSLSKKNLFSKDNILQNIKEFQQNESLRKSRVSLNSNLEDKKNELEKTLAKKIKLTKLKGKIERVLKNLDFSEEKISKLGTSLNGILENLRKTIKAKRRTEFLKLDKTGQKFDEFVSLEELADLKKDKESLVKNFKLQCQNQGFHYTKEETDRNTLQSRQKDIQQHTKVIDSGNEVYNETLQIYENEDNFNNLRQEKLNLEKQLYDLHDKQEIIETENNQIKEIFMKIFEKSLILVKDRISKVEKLNPEFLIEIIDQVTLKIDALEQRVQELEGNQNKQGIIQKDLESNSDNFSLKKKEEEFNSSDVDEMTEKDLKNEQESFEKNQNYEKNDMKGNYIDSKQKLEMEEVNMEEDNSSESLDMKMAKEIFSKLINKVFGLVSDNYKHIESIENQLRDDIGDEERVIWECIDASKQNNNNLRELMEFLSDNLDEFLNQFEFLKSNNLTQREIYDNVVEEKSKLQQELKNTQTRYNQIRTETEKLLSIQNKERNKKSIKRNLSEPDIKENQKYDKNKFKEILDRLVIEKRNSKEFINQAENNFEQDSSEEELKRKRTRLESLKDEIRHSQKIVFDNDSAEKILESILQNIYQNLEFMNKLEPSDKLRQIYNLLDKARRHIEDEEEISVEIEEVRVLKESLIPQELETNLKEKLIEIENKVSSKEYNFGRSGLLAEPKNYNI